MASAAAPTFFDEVALDVADSDGDGVYERGYFVDGAVGANNNPSMQLLMLALIPAYGFHWRGGADHLMITSFGTGQRKPEISGEAFQDMAPGLRGVHALKSMIYDTQIQGIMIMQALSEPKRPWRINSEVGEMRGTVLGHGPILDYQRIDALLPLKLKLKKSSEAASLTRLEQAIGRELSAKEMHDLDALDNGKPQNLGLLLEIGTSTGPAFIGSDYPDPKFDLAEWR
jgi:hypothetical protein